MTTKSSGKVFENRVENLFLATPEFNDNIFNNKGFVNVYNYKKFCGSQGVEFSEAVQRLDQDLLLFKDFPHGNDMNNNTEFCVVHKIGDEVIKWRLECKFQDVNGTTYQKIAYGFDQYHDFKTRTAESYYITVYDGEHYNTRPEIVADVLRSIKKWGDDVLFLSFDEFKLFLRDYLLAPDDHKSVFKKYHDFINK